MPYHADQIRRAFLWLGVGLILLIASSRLVVWGAVEVVHGFGVSDLIIGLTIVAVGTSLPDGNCDNLPLVNPILCKEKR